MFKVEGLPDKQPVTVFSQHIDEDGDLLLIANDIKLGYIDHADGVLYWFFLTEQQQEQLPELRFKEGQLVLGT